MSSRLDRQSTFSGTGEVRPAHRFDVARLEALFLPPEPAPAAYVCLGTACSAPVTEPSALAEAVEKMRSSGIQTLE